MNKRDKIIQLSIQNQGEWIKITKAIQQNQQIHHLHQLHTPCITILDEEYPDVLKQLRYPPWVLFYEGDITLLKKKCITIIGSRELSQYGINCTNSIASTLSQRYVIVSGLAKGADSCAHASTIRSLGKTIGVIGSGLNYVYPKCNASLYQEMKRNHLILSEYPFDVPIQKHHFVWRNRILAALGDKCIVTSAKKRSGTMLTVNEAITLGKDVWCVPYGMNQMEGEGCNLLIEQGAQILYDTKQLYDL